MASNDRRSSSAFPGYPTFDHVEPPQSQDCPDCPARAGEPCIHADPLMSKTMVHIRRCFTPSSNAAIERYYDWEREHD